MPAHPRHDAAAGSARPPRHQPGRDRACRTSSKSRASWRRSPARSRRSRSALAIVGIYGVTTFVTGQRTREIGLRIAVGASRGDVLRLLLKDSLRPVAIGLAAGAVRRAPRQPAVRRHPLWRGRPRSAGLRERDRRPAGVGRRRRLHSRPARRAGGPGVRAEAVMSDPGEQVTAVSTRVPSGGAEKQLTGFVSKFEPKHRSLIRAVRKALRKRFPTAYRAGVRQLQLLRHRLLADGTPL